MYIIIKFNYFLEMQVSGQKKIQIIQKYFIDMCVMVVGGGSKR